MAKELIKGNEAIIKGALLAGCEAYYGYPITPASEIAHAAADYFPLLGRTFLQAESEIAAINMVYGASSAGQRVITASSGPGLSLKQEGISYCAGSELPCVIVSIMRGGPGLGNIAPDQGDYNQIVKGGGHGNYRMIVLAPNCAQEMCELTVLAFDLADKYRNPVCVLADGFIGQMMEPVVFPEPRPRAKRKTWAVEGTKETSGNLISSILLDPDELEAHVNHLMAKYAAAEENEQRCEEHLVEDADAIVVGYGICSRVLVNVVEQARAEGFKLGMLRPISLWPFPKRIMQKHRDRAKFFLAVELSIGMMVEDVRAAIEYRKPVHYYGRKGGNVPGPEEILELIRKLYTEVPS